MTNSIIKSWKDEAGRRWYLTDIDPYPYLSATSIVSVAKSYRYRERERTEQSNKNLKKAADLGTDIHSVMEWYNRSLQEEEFDIDPKLLVRHKEILERYKDFISLIEMNEGKIEILECERACFNPVFKYAGRFDLLVKVGEDIEIWDYKTSKNIHEEDGWQLAAYMVALLMEGVPVKRVRIIHIDKIAKKFTDLKYIHFNHMFRKFLNCLEVVTGVYFNDMLKGRINDIDTLQKYKWPLDELLKDYVQEYNNNKEKYMELTPVTGLGDGPKFVKDPNRVDFSEPVIGVILGNVPVRWVHKTGKKVYMCTGRDKCERCKLDMKKSIQFKANFLTIDSNDKAVLKKIESESTRLYFALSDALKKIKDEGGDVTTAVLKIERTGKSFDTEYKVTNIAPKHKALLNVAETIKPMKAFDLTFDATEDTGFNQTKEVDRSDIVEK